MIEITTIMGNSSAPALSPYCGCAEMSVPFMSGKSIRQRLAPDVGEKGAGCASCVSYAQGEELVREPEPYPRLPKAPEPAHVPLAGHGRAFEMHGSERGRSSRSRVPADSGEIWVGSPLTRAQLR